jgi:hypothetical protein
MWQRVPFLIFLIALGLVTACTDLNLPTAEAPSKPKEKYAVNVLPLTQGDAGAHQSCTGIGDPTCSAQGPGGIALVCQVQTMECGLMMDIDKCTTPDDPTANLDCPWKPCSLGDSCDDGNSDTVDKCQATDAPVAKGYGGVCTNLNSECWVAKGSPCEAQGQYVCESGTCHCTAKPLTPVSPTELCDNVDNDCNGVTDDGKNADGSDFALGLACDGTDTDKCQWGKFVCTSNKMGSECSVESKGPFVEACDGDDNDCDGVTDDKWPEVADSKVTACDGDDADQCKKGAYMCNDLLNGVVCVEVGKNVAEVCNGIDDTCEGTADEGCDVDGDKYCTKTMAVLKGATCNKSTIPSDSSSVAGDDCKDTDAAINPGASEVCDSVDQNCNGEADEGFSVGIACKSDEGLAPSHGVCQTSGFWQCGGSGVICSGVKDDSKKVTELCNALDDDCDGLTDEGCDDDADLYCDATMTVTKDAKCSKSVLPASGTAAGDDCKDLVKAINPGTAEVCDNIDNNCGGSTDEGCDDDKDGYCDAAMAFASGALCTNGDCNDDDAARNPGATEVCNTKDDNCDGKTDVAVDGSSVCASMCTSAAAKLKCGDTVKLNMATNPFKGAVTANSYKCLTVAPKTFTYTTYVSASDLYAVFDCPGVPKVNVSAKAPNGETGRMFALTGCNPTSGAYNETQCLAQGQFYTSKLTGPVTTMLKGLDPSKLMLGFESDTEVTELEVTVTAAP